MTYQQVLQILFENKNDRRAIFNAKIIKSKINNLGVSSSVVLDISKELVALIVRVVIPPLVRAIIANLPESTSFHLILSTTTPL